MMGGSGKDTNQPYPDIRSAFTLTLLAMLAAAFTGIAFIDFGILAAVGIGQAIGVGAVATMGAKRVAEPQAVRLGLRALDTRAIPVILCLAPAILVVSELDNFATDWSGSATPTEISRPTENVEEPEAPIVVEEVEEKIEDNPGERIAIDEAPREPTAPLINTDDPWSLLSAFVVMVGISPVVEEFLFRGVIQQGLVARMGLLRGVAMVALLWTLLRPAPLAGVARFLTAAVASFGLGWLLGMVRIASRSILGSILLASAWAGVGLIAVALEDRLPLPGMNVEGTHLPWSVTIASVLLVGWAGWAIYQEADKNFRNERASTAAAEQR